MRAKKPTQLKLTGVPTELPTEPTERFPDYRPPSEYDRVVAKYQIERWDKGKAKAEATPKSYIRKIGKSEKSANDNTLELPFTPETGRR